MKPLVYIAGPYTHPDPVANTHRAIRIADTFIEDGVATPIVPHLTMLWHLVNPQEIDYWYLYDLDVLAHCHAVYRIPGASTGADKEVEFAHERGIPVCHTGMPLTRQTTGACSMPISMAGRTSEPQGDKSSQSTTRQTAAAGGSVSSRHSAEPTDAINPT